MHQYVSIVHYICRLLHTGIIGNILTVLVKEWFCFRDMYFEYRIMLNTSKYYTNSNVMVYHVGINTNCHAIERKTYEKKKKKKIQIKYNNC